MLKFYEKHEVLFAVLLIVLYCVVMSPLKAEGYSSIWMLVALAAFAVGMTVFVKAGHLEEKFGLTGWPKDMKKYLYFIPVWVLATGNLWDGLAPSYTGIPLLIATLSMALVGYVEEMIFRGFLFKAMLADGNKVVAIVVSSVTFGIGHIVNLLSGQATFETVVQMVFAVAWGFLFTMVYYVGGSLIPCIIAHAMIDVFAQYGADNWVLDRVVIGATVIVAIVYSIYLGKIKKDEVK